MQGWYFYNKTKNYRVLLGGLKEAGVDAVKIGGVATGWVVIEEGYRRMGVEDVSEVAAGLGTAGLFSLACELFWSFALARFFK